METKNGAGHLMDRNKLLSVKTRLELDLELAEYIISVLSNDIDEYGNASLIVSGGSTPVQLFKLLSHYNIDWSKITISLVDERFVPDDHPDQNGQMIKQNLLKKSASKAIFLPMVLNQINPIENLKQVRSQMKSIRRPFSMVILGMGSDGHTASLFPEAMELDEGMRLNTNQDIIISHPSNAPHERITFTRKSLLNTSRLVLHCYGKEKKAILDKAKVLDDYRPYPIQGFINQDKVELKIYWTE